MGESKTMAKDSNGNVHIALSVGIYPVTTPASEGRLSKIVAIGFPRQRMTEDEMTENLHNPEKVAVEYLSLAGAKAMVVELQEAIDYLTKVTMADHVRLTEARDSE